MDNSIYRKIIEKINFGYAYHKIILDDNGKPIDYIFLDVNKSFEIYTGLKKEEIINKKFLEDIAGEEDPEFDWIKTYGEIAINGGEIEFNQYSTVLDRYYTIKAFSPGKYYFVTLFQDKTLEKGVQEISKYFLESIGTNIDYDKITRFIVELSGAKYAAFNQFEDNGKDFQTKALIGLSKNIKKGMDILGFNVKNKKWSYDKKREEKIKESTITYFSKLSDLTENVIPNMIIRKIEDKFNLGTTVVAKITKDKIALGDFTLIFEKNKELKNEDLLEIYLNQVGLFLERKRIEKNLIKTQREYYELAQKSPIGILSCDREGNIKFINSKMMKILNSPDLEKTKQINLLKFDLLKKYGFSEKLKKVIETGKPITFEMGYKGKYHKNSWLRVNINSYKEKDEVVGARITVDDITDKKIDEEILKKRVETDPLTGAYNRNVLKNSILEDKLKESMENNLISCVAIIDVDDFKDINDSYGHRIGDYILKYFTKRIKNELRKEDILVRTGGDEFLIYLHDIKNEKNANYFIKRIFNKCSSSYRIEDNIKGEKFSLNISCSIGASFYPSDGENIEELMAMADTALYNVKETGKSRFFYYDPTRQNHKVERYKKRQEIIEYIEKDQIIPFYQPIFDKSGSIKRLEALARIKNGDEIIQPSGFITVSENTYLIEKIGEMILNKVIEDISSWKERGFHKKISVNLSSRQLHYDFYKRTIEKLKDKNLQNYIVFEITEEIIMSSKEEIIDVLKKFRNEGIKISLDDFGVGYSSLARLSSLPLDEIKIDRIFIKEIENKEKNRINRAIIKGIIELGKPINIDIIVEGIETEEQLAVVKELGCELFQGFYFEKPVSKEDFNNKYLNFEGGK